jgi:hypothetical protein
LLSTAAVIAMLELLKQAASLFSWTLAMDRLDGILGEARAVNETAAHLPLVRAGPAADRSP